MRYLSITTITFLLFSCSSYDYVVESDYSYNGSFHRYKSFDFADNSNFSGSDEERALIEKYLGSTLGSWGYNRNSKKPSLVIFYTLYYDDLDFQGYNQPEFQTWMKSNYPGVELTEEVDSLYDRSTRWAYDEDENYTRKMYALQEGTLLISLFDRRKKETVWQGYASGIFNNDTENNKRVLRSAVIQILDKYQVVAFQSS